LPDPLAEAAAERVSILRAKIEALNNNREFDEAVVRSDMEGL